MRSSALPSSSRRSSFFALTGIAAFIAMSAGACSLLVSFDKSGSGGAGGGGGSVIGVCSVDDDCLGPGQTQNSCYVAKCIGGECNINAKPDGEELAPSAQVMGDCLKKICMSNAPVDQPDSMDTGDDGNPCTVEACNGTMPTTMNAPSGDSCGGPGLVCDGMGKCKGCKADGDCPMGTACSGFVCDTQKQECNDAPVMAGTVVPMDQQMAGDCQVLVCDGNGDTMPMNDDTDAPAPPDECTTSKCVGGMPVSTPAMVGTTCKGTGACDGTGMCKGGTGTTCAAAGDCGSGFCVDAVCCDTACTGKCQSCTAALKGSGMSGTCGPTKAATDPDTDCTAPQTCNGMGACATPKLPNGSPCAMGTECTSTFCADGVCCDKACNGVCEACTAAIAGQGTDGTCGPIKSGLDPATECMAPMKCNGMGMCM